jgi:hypothetical protein
MIRDEHGFPVVGKPPVPPPDPAGNQAPVPVEPPCKNPRPAGITVDDRLQALLSELFTWHAFLAVLTVLGAVAIGLQQSGLHDHWVYVVITALGVAEIIGANIAKAFGHGQLTTVLRVNGKLPPY